MKTICCQFYDASPLSWPPFEPNAPLKSAVDLQNKFIWSLWSLGTKCQPHRFMRIVFFSGYLRWHSGNTRTLDPGFWMLDVGCWMVALFLALTRAKAASCQTLIIWCRGVKNGAAPAVCGSIRGVVMCGYKGLRGSWGSWVKGGELGAEDSGINVRGQGIWMGLFMVTFIEFIT